MGIFSKAISKVANVPIINKVVTSKAFDIGTKPLQYIGAVVANPVTAITKSPKSALKQAQTESFEKQAGKVLLNTGTVAAAVLTGGTTAGRTAAATVGKALTPTTPKGIITATVGGIAATGVITKTKKPIETISKAPKELFEFGQGIGGVIENPSAESVKQLVKDSPILTTAAVGLGAVTLGKSLLPAAVVGSNISTKEAVQDLTEQLGNQTNLPTTTAAATTVATNTGKPIAPNTAVTPATQTISKTSTSRRKKTRRKAPQSNINQRVNIMVANKNTSNGIRVKNTKYIKEIPLR